jgi:hypothetical protein|tara:strand:+ start:832 stop:969 length:138 start_codon:yes stop_codon:yes gene_type:complete
MRDWEITASLYFGILFGFRTYKHKGCTDYVLYFPFIDLSLTVYYE